ncbi:hypothetical protein SIID45300_01968 [Candidatus Magnetaquicoccaceae bacterium FCR-1]|uniref:PBP domain-containing protein n=1 Tax=Candidatus Magnetaquiglobus chichijimensis TaxID=3141448 RepID=A0ABQ0C9S9_9PROT
MIRQTHLLWLWLTVGWWILPALPAQASLVSEREPPRVTSASEAEQAVLKALDRAFCAPDQTFPQLPSWVAQPIRPDRWGQGGDLVIMLDQQIHQLLLPTITRYAHANQLDIRVREGTCGTSAGLISRKAVDIAGFCCPPGKSDRLPGLTFHTLGVASIAILLHPDNPIGDLTIPQVKEIFQGQHRQWTQISDRSGQIGPAWDIQPIGRLHCKLRPGHWRALLPDPDDFSPRMEEVGTIADMLQRILAQRGAIGYETLWHVDRFRQNGRAKPVVLDGIAPNDVAALTEGRYPLYHVFNVTIWEGEGVVNPHARELVRHLDQAIEAMDPSLTMIPASTLRQAGWIFRGEELIGEPERP